MASKRKVSAVLEGSACKPFRDHLAVVAAAKPRSWAQVQDGFLRAMEKFDAEVIAGRASEGERQNGKGDYFNDLIVAILQEASGRQLNVRRGVNGLIVKNYNLDVTYPAEGVAELLVEAKVMGTPKHPGSAEEMAEGRRGSADLPKRLREAAFKTIDLKAGFSLQQSQSGKSAQSGLCGSGVLGVGGRHRSSTRPCGARDCPATNHDVSTVTSEIRTQNPRASRSLLPGRTTAPSARHRGR